jgi:hypothetical protein
MKHLILAIALMWATMVQANIIEISSSADNDAVLPGDVVNYSINLIDFEEFDFLSFDLFFGSSTLMTDFTLLSSDFPDALTSSDFSGLEAFESASNTVSFNLTAPFAFDPLASTYSGSALLASFSVKASASGIMESMISNLVSEFSFVQLQNEVEVRVSSPVDVSAPATLGLLGMAALALFGFRRKA